MTLRALVSRLVALGRKDRLDRELDAEVLAHLELAERDLMATGLSPEEARQAARRLFGGVEQMKEDHRDQRGVRWIDNLMQDCRYGLATLKRDRLFAVIAIGVLALGIGANTAMFSLVDGVLLKPLPFSHPDRIVWVWEAPDRASRNQTTARRFTEWKLRSRSFDALSAQAETRATIMVAGQATRLPGRSVSADYFAVFGIKPLLGRTFLPDDDRPGASPVIVLSHATWQTRFGGDPGILSRNLVIDDTPHQIIGVLPAGAFDRDLVGFWKPLALTADQLQAGEHWLPVVGRLKPDVSLGQARQEMLAVNASLADITPQWKRDAGWTVALDPFADPYLGTDLRRSMYIAFGAVVLVLLIACANLANLLLARGVARTKEMAVRSALGAGRGRLVVQLMTETLLLCLLGAAAGVGIAALLIEIGVPLIRASLPFTAEIGLDLRVLGFAALAAMAVSLLIGVLPSFHATSRSLAPELNQASRGTSTSHSFVRRTIVMAEVALSFVLVCGALLLIRSVLKLQHADIGVRVERVITMSTDLPASGYPNPDSAAVLYRTLVERLQAVPGVERAALSQDLPLEGVRGGEFMVAPGADGQLLVRFKRVDAGYFGVLDIPIVSGRGIQEADRAGSPRVVVINQELARRLAAHLGVTNPVGQTVKLAAPGYQDGSSMVDVRVVGVIRSERVRDARLPADDVAYVPLAQVPRQDVRLLVRTSGDPASVAPSIREALRQIDPRLPLEDVRTLEQVKTTVLSDAAEPAWAMGVFAAIAALLAAFGLYGVLAHTVAQQRREIGIRLALGATSGGVIALVVRNGLRMLLSGLLVGVVVAIGITRIARALLFEISPLDPTAFAAGGVSMVIVATLAVLIPAARAAAVDPATALRSEF